jgi:hypothetical protein
MRRYLIAATLVAALTLPSMAAAKGPSAASVSGPGLGRTLAVTGQGEGPGTPLGSLATTGGFFAQMFGDTYPTQRTQPKGTLGPRYTVVYTVPGPDNITSRVVQYAYPYAKPVPLTYMKPGQPFWGNRATYGGWFVALPSLKRMLLRAGLPAKAPARIR